MLEENLSIIKKRYPHWLIHLEDKEPSLAHTISKTRTNNITLKCSHKNKEYLYHSRYDPVKEAKNILSQSLSSLPSSPSVLIIGGFALGYLTSEAFSSLKNTKIVVCDCDWELLKIALENRTLSFLLGDERVYFLINETEAVFNNLLSSFQTSNIAHIFHKSSETIYPKYYKKLFHIISNFKNTKEINIATSNRFQKVWSKNILKNLLDFVSHKGINSLSGYYKGEAAVIVAAGPSLLKNIFLLKEIKGKVIIIAVDTVFQVLLRHGIDPDFVIAVDPQDINKKYFDNLTESKAILICEPSISPKIMRSYNRKIMLGSLFHLVKWIEDISEVKGSIEIGGSVATAAYSVAKLFGCDPIVFIGLDLAYSDDLSHIKGTYFEELWFYNYSRFENPYMLLTDFISRLSHFRVRGYCEGDSVRTDRKFDMFRSWFENQFKKSKGKIIDATEGGSHKNNCSPLSLKEFIEGYCANKEFKDFTEGIELKNKLSGTFIEKLLSELSKLLLSLKALEKDVRRAVRLTDELYALVLRSVKYAKALTNRVFEINKELDKIETKIVQDRAMNSFISLTIQSIINEIDDNKQDNLSNLEKANNDLRIARQSQVLYSGIRDGILFNIKYFSYAITKLEAYLVK